MIIDNAEQREIEFAEDAWLNYFNRYLFEHGTISTKEFKRMTELIACRKRRKRIKAEERKLAS